jgi:hypothetical protein
VAIKPIAVNKKGQSTQHRATAPSFFRLDRSDRLFRARGKPEWQVQRARANRTGQQENDGQNAQDDRGRSRNLIHEIENPDNDGNDDANDAIEGAHVFFHGMTSESGVDWGLRKQENERRDNADA